MPTSGTHITIVQRIAADPKYQPLLGNPDPTLAEDDPAAIKMKYACLGACGPDIFYALADYGGELQDLEDFLTKMAGSFQCLGELSEQINRYIGQDIDLIMNDLTGGLMASLKETFGLIGGVISEGLLALVASGVNLWPVFEPARQQDEPRSSWFWADYLHYIRSGAFVRTLLEKSKGNDNLHAYALGYLTHYVTDVVGHPYVNQVVGAPWRLAWQRHHLVENFIDAYVWDRWHQSLPAPPAPSTEEEPLDALVQTPNDIGAGAPFTYSRLNDWTNIGSPTAGDPIDGIIDSVCTAIEKSLFQLGIVDDFVPVPPPDPEFKAWTQLMVDCLHATYTESARPMNLAKGILPGGASRVDGFPIADDVAGAYTVFRLVLSVATEDKIEEPQPPDIVGDVSKAVQDMLDKVKQDLGNIPAPPAISMSGDFSWDAFVDAVEKTAAYVAEVAGAVAAAVVDTVAGIIKAAAVGAIDAVKYLLYLLNKALFALYRAARDVLVLHAYATPLTMDIIGTVGPLDMTTLWKTLGEPPAGTYPHEESLQERKYLGSVYDPSRPLTTPPEQPAVAWAAPYVGRKAGKGKATVTLPATPDDFIDAALGPDDMFKPTGPQAATKVKNVETFAATKKNFGGAIANSKHGIDLALAGFPGGTMLPDYNLDGDRGYAWPAWDVIPAPTDTAAGDPLAPDAPANTAAGVATVHAVKVAG